MATKQQPMPDATELAHRMHAAMQAARENLERGFAIADELYDAATGDVGPRDERVQRLEHAVGEDVRSFKLSFARDANLVLELGYVVDAASDIVDLVALACTPREAVAS